MGSRLISREGAVLVIIDAQEKLFPLVVGRERVLENILKLVKFARIVGIPILLTEQYPVGLGPTVRELREELPDVRPIEKTTFSCFGSPEFREQLGKVGAKTLILTGIETHVCVSQTALDALDEFRVCVVADAVSSRTEENWRISLERMRDGGAIVLSAEMLMFEVLRDAKTREFKEALKFLK